MSRRVHKQAWGRRGDVYHLLFDLTFFIYGTSWRREDAVIVYMLFALIHHTTGAHPMHSKRKPARLHRNPSLDPVDCSPGVGKSHGRWWSDANWAEARVFARENVTGPRKMLIRHGYIT